MITEDRIQLNDRFRVVFGLLEQRGVVIKNDRGGKGMGDFAYRILGNRAYGHIIRAYLNPDDKRVISYSQARTLCREFGVSEAYMLDGTGTPFGRDPGLRAAPKSATGNTDVPAGLLPGNIRFTSFEAFAGFATDSGARAYEAESKFFTLPGLDADGLVAFPISGNSMEPVITDGDVVICREVSNLKHLRDNAIYAVKSDGAVWIKYIRPVSDARGRITQLKLISANHLEHDPFTEDVSEDLQIFQVIRRITAL